MLFGKLRGYEHEVLELHSQGKAAKEIASQVGVEAATIRRFLKFKDIKMHNGPASVLDPHLHEIYRLYNDERRTIGEIGKVFNVTETAVWKFLKRKNIKIRDRKQLRVYNLIEINDLYNNQKWSVAQIACHLGVTYAPLWRFMEKHGVTMRPCGARPGEDNVRWMGNNVSYVAAHERVRKLKGGNPTSCIICKSSETTRKYQWASMTENYSDIHDYQGMCMSCHKKRDNEVRRQKFNITTARERWDAKIAENKEKIKDGNFIYFGTNKNSMHLNQRQIQSLLPTLHEFAETGRIQGYRSSTFRNYTDIDIDETDIKNTMVDSDASPDQTNNDT